MGNSSNDNKNFASELLSKLKANLFNDAEDMPDTDEEADDFMKELGLDGSFTDFDEENDVSVSDDADGVVEDDVIDNASGSLTYNVDDYAAPDEELYSSLSAGGKVCDIPADYSAEGDGDTKDAPLRKGNISLFNIMNDGADNESDTGTVDISELIESLRVNAGTNGESGDDSDFVKGDTVPFGTVYGDTLWLNDDVNPIIDDNSDDVLSEIYGDESDTTNDTAETVSFSPVNSTEEDDQLDGMMLNGTEDTVPDGSNSLCPVETTDENDDAAEFDETDANLMIAFGLDEELNNAIGKENAEKLVSDNEIVTEVQDTEKISSAPEYKEFISSAETKTVLDGYLSKFKRNTVRIFVCVVTVILLFFFENITALGGHYPDVVDPDYYPTVYVMVGLQILFVGFAIMFDRMVKGIKAIKNRQPIPESYIPVLFVFSVIYSVCIYLFVPGTNIVTFFFPTSLSLLLCAVNERLDLNRELMSFKIVSSKMAKFAFEKLDVGEAELETKAFNEFLPKQPSIFKINKTEFVDGYFRRTYTYPSMKLVLKAFIPVTALISVLSFIVGFAIYKDWQAATVLSYLVFSFVAPASVYLSFGLPMYKASKVAYADKSAIIGEAALDEYTTASSISFDDREVFPTSGVMLKSIKVFGSGCIDNVVYYTANIYSLLGGPFADILKGATADLDYSDNVEILNVDSEGVEALVDGKHLFAGRADYLLKNNYTPVTDPEDEDIEGDGEISIMFLVCDDEVIAKLYIRYKIDRNFERTLKRLYKSGICVGIKTVDPNINDEMLSTKIKLTKYPVRVLKYAGIGESKHGTEHTDSGIVSRKSANSLLNTFTLCDKVKHTSRTNIMVNIINIAVGLAIAAMIAVFGTPSAVSSIYIALFQIFWIVPMLLMSRFMLR